MQDKFVTCKKCGSHSCYETEIGALKSWVCMKCGFTTNNYLQEGSEEQKSYELTLPELYKDLKFIDVDNNAWYPSTINFPEKGMVFVDGTSVDNWMWAGVLVKRVDDDEKEAFKKKGTEEYYAYKVDMKSKKLFGRDDYFESLDYVGLLGG